MRCEEEKVERGMEEKENENGRKGKNRDLKVFYKLTCRYFHMRSGHFFSLKRMSKL